MITNLGLIKDKFKCNKTIMEYLVYKCNLPLLGYNGNDYYFTYDNKLKVFLEKMPFHLKLFSLIS